MDRKGQIGVVWILTAFMLVILGITLASELTNQADLIDVTRTQANTTVAAENLTYVDILPSNGIGIVEGTLVVYNDTGATGTENLWTENTDYTVDYAEGEIALIGIHEDQTLSNVTFDYYPDEYVQDANSRTLLGLTPLFFIVGLVLLVLFLVVRKTGLLDNFRVG